MTAVAVLGANARILTNSSLPTAPSSSNPALLVYFDDIKGSDWLAPSTSDIDAWMFAIVRAQERTGEPVHEKLLPIADSFS